MTSDDRQGPQDTSLGGDAAHLGAEPAAAIRPGRDGGRALRVLALIAVALGLAGLTAAACVLSYSPIHRLAIQAGVHGRLASIYPLIFDALLVVAGCSVLALRGAGLVSRVYSWLCLLVLLAALAAGGAARAATVAIPHKTAAVVAAIVPWALVLIGFGLLLALLRYARLRRTGKRDGGREAGARPSAEERAGGPAADGPAANGPAADGRAADQVSDQPQPALAPGLSPESQPIAGPRTDAEAAAVSRVPDLVKAGKRAEGTGGQAATRPAAAPQADASSGGSGVEPPTVPGSAIHPLQGSPVADRTADQPAAAAPSPSAPSPSAPSPSAPSPSPALPAETAEYRPGVRRADLQLRARIPRQPGQDPAGAHPAGSGWPTPFMPKVGQKGTDAGRPPADQHERAGEAGAEEATAAAAKLPKRVPGQQPVTSGLQPAPAAPTSPRPPADQAAGRAAAPGDTTPATPTAPAEPDDAPAPTSTLNPAPTHDDAAEDADGLPAFRRPRSTPTPPQGDEPRADEPQGDEPRADERQQDEERT
jgi:hypothetical protein